MSDLTDRFPESLTRFTKPIAPFAESPETSDLLQEADLAGVEEINGYRTTHFRMTTETMLALMMDAYRTVAPPR